MKTLLEIREYNFEGVTLHVELDRRTGKASFVEWDDRKNTWLPKDWKFAGRELEYMNGWHNILSAMQYVIAEAKKEMKKWDDEKSDKLVSMLLAIQDADREIRKAADESVEKTKNKVV